MNQLTIYICYGKFKIVNWTVPTSTAIFVIGSIQGKVGWPGTIEVTQPFL